MNLTRPSDSGRWKTIRAAMEGWGTTARVCVIILVGQLPADIGVVIWVITRR